MADVFISYAKPDRPLASKLAAMLEAEGWKVWWDTSLTIGDDFRNEIMTELGRARAVIVVWTDTSIKSDWVRSEAGRAQADRKLIPVKLAHLVYEDLPPPFDVLHTEDIGQEDKIKAAVVAQLAKPAVEPSPWALLAKGLKWELLTWWGIIGGAIALFVAISTTLKLADWARWLVEHWKEWTHDFLVWAFGWLGLHLPPEWIPVLSFLLFWLFLTIGQVVKFKSTVETLSTRDKYQGRAFRFTSAQMLGCLVIMVMFLGFFSDDLSSRTIKFYYVLALFLALAPIGIVRFETHRLHAYVSVALMLIFFTIITLAQLSDLDGAERAQFRISDVVLLLVLIAATWMSPLILLSVAPAKAVSRRLIFLALGLLLLIALNELSKLGIDLTAPKLQG